MMKLEGEYVFDGPREQVWEIVRDPEVLSSALPGTQSLEQVGENEFAGKMHVRIGPVSGVFAGKITVSDEVPPESYTLVGDSKAGAAGFGRGSADVFLIEEGSITVLRYDADFKVGGKLAQVGSRLVAGATKKTADDFFGKFSTELDPGARRIEIEEGIEVEEEEGIEAAEAAMMLSRIGKIAAFVIVVLLIAWFLLG